MDNDVRDMLERVADGSLDPAEAARLLDERAARSAAESETSHRADEPTAAAEDSTPPAPRRPSDGVRRLVVRVAYRGVRLVGDPSVATVAVDGEHRLARDGDAVVVSDAVGSRGFEMSQMARPEAWAAVLRQNHRPLVLRANPALTAEVEISAGSVHAEGMPRLSRVRVTAGSARVRDVAEPLDLVVQAGSASVAARPRHGRWTLRTESGSLSLQLLPGSDARVTGHASLGRVSVGPDGAQSGITGAGAADVDVEVVMGSATVELP